MTFARKTAAATAALVILLGLAVGIDAPCASAETQGEAIVQKAASQIGVTYCFAGGGPTVGRTHGEGDLDGEAPDCMNSATLGFDCSGLALWAVYQATGGAVDLPHSASLQASRYASYGGQLITSESALQPGDLIFFGDPGGLSNATHVGIYAGPNKMWDANTAWGPYGDGVYERSISETEHDPHDQFLGGVRYWHGTGGESPGEGSFVSYEGNVYRIAGGAPIYVSNWAVFGGPQPTTALSSQQWSALRQYPADGTGLCGQQVGGGGGAFVVAGGAPIYIASFSNVNPNPCIPVDEFAINNAGGGSVLEHLRQYPADGTGLCGQQAGGGGGAFVVAGGAPIYITNFNNVNPNPCIPVDQFAINHAGEDAWWNHLRQYPADGTGLCGQQAGGVGGAFVVAGGAPIYITNFNNVDPSPCTPVDQVTLNNAGGEGWYGHLRQYPADGTGLCGQQAGGGGDAFVVAGGAPMYISSFEHVNPNPCIPVDQVTLEDAGGEGWFGHLRQYPVDGTFLKTSNGDTYRIAGGTPFPITSWSVFGGEQPFVTVDQWDLENPTNPAAHLSPAPLDGTVVEGLPSGAYWAFDNGERQPAAPSAAAVAISDESLSLFPLHSSPTASQPTPTTSSSSETKTTSPGATTPSTTTPAHGVLSIKQVKRATPPALSRALARCHRMKNRHTRTRCEAAAKSDTHTRRRTRGPSKTQHQARR
jgi:cell wall-associated NlpC family hydrolase